MLQSLTDDSKGQNNNKKFQFCDIFCNLFTFKHLRMSSEWIKLNIGGVVYQTTRMTLMKDQNSMIFSMFSENELMEPGKMEDGCYLIDR